MKRFWLGLALLLTGCASGKLEYEWKRYPAGDTLTCEFPVPPVAEPRKVDFFVRGYALEKGHTEKIPVQQSVAGVPPTQMPIVCAAEYLIPEKSAEEPHAGQDWLRRQFGEDARRSFVQIGSDEPVDGPNGLKGLTFAFQHQSQGTLTRFRIFQNKNRLYLLSVEQKKGSEKPEIEQKFFESAQIAP